MDILGFKVYMRGFTAASVGWNKSEARTAHGQWPALAPRRLAPQHG